MIDPRREHIAIHEATAQHPVSRWSLNGDPIYHLPIQANDDAIRSIACDRVVADAPPWSTHRVRKRARRRGSSPMSIGTTDAELEARSPSRATTRTRATTIVLGMTIQPAVPAGSVMPPRRSRTRER